GRGGACPAPAAIVNAAPMSVSASASISTGLILIFMFILFCLAGRQQARMRSDLAESCAASFLSHGHVFLVRPRSTGRALIPPDLRGLSQNRYGSSIRYVKTVIPLFRKGRSLFARLIERVLGRSLSDRGARSATRGLCQVIHTRRAESWPLLARHGVCEVRHAFAQARQFRHPPRAILPSWQMQPDRQRPRCNRSWDPSCGLRACRPLR